MDIDGEWRIAFIEDQAPKLDYGAAPMPVDDDKPTCYGAGYITGNVIGVPRGAKNPEAAWELVKYLTTDTDALVKLANGIKNVPTTTAALDSPDLQKDPHSRSSWTSSPTRRRSTTPPTSTAAGVPGDVPGRSSTTWQSGKVTTWTRV